MKYAIGATAKFEDGSGGYMLEEHPAAVDEDAMTYRPGAVILFDTREQAEAAIRALRGKLKPANLPAGMMSADWIVIECPNDVPPDEDAGSMQ